LGTRKPFLEYKMEGEKMVCYGWSVDYDRDGNETGRTQPEVISSMSGLPAGKMLALASQCGIEVKP